MGDLVKRNNFADVMRKFFKMGLFKIIPSQGTIKEKHPSPNSDDGEPDLVSTIIGDYGRWQLLVTFMLSLFSFPCTFHIYLPTFTARDRNFWCRQPENLSDLSLDDWINYSQPVNACYVRVLPPRITAASIINNSAPVLDAFTKCSEWDFDTSEVTTTIISEWNLVCDRAGLTNISEMVFLIGVGIGGVVGGWISDKFGRKRILVYMVVAQSMLAIVTLFVKSFILYVIMRIVMGLVSVSVVYAAFVLCVELVGGKWVTIAGVCNFFPLPLAYVIVSLASIALPNWRDLQLALSIPGCILAITAFFLPESPRWLLTMGRGQEARSILEQAAKFNKRDTVAEIDKLLLAQKMDHKPQDPNVLILFKGNLLKTTICLFLAWFSMTIAYYGLVLNIGNFNLGNLHLTSIILALVEVPAIALSIPILLKAGRRIPIFTTMVICGVACIASELFSLSFNNDWFMIACLMVGKFAISTTNMMLPIYTAELYPTLFRNLGVGGSQMSAGIALMCIPYLWEMTTINNHLPMVTIAVLSAAGGGIILLLQDTTTTKSSKSIKTTAVETTLPCNGTFTVTEDKGYRL